MDTGVFYALFDTSDLHHLDSVELLTHALEGKFGRPYGTDYAVLETTMLLKVRTGGKATLSLLTLLERGSISIIVVGEESYKRARSLFKEKIPRLSLCDAATLVVMEELGINQLASYDERSFSGLAKSIVGRGYFESLPENEKRQIRESTRRNVKTAGTEG